MKNSDIDVSGVLLYKDIKDLSQDRDRTLSFADRVELVREFEEWFVGVGSDICYEDANGNWQTWENLPKPHQSRIQNVWMYHEKHRNSLGLGKKAARLLEQGELSADEAVEATQRVSQEQRLLDKLGAFKAANIELQSERDEVSIVRQPVMFQGRTNTAMRRGYGAHRGGFQVVERGLYYGCTRMPMLAIWNDAILNSAMSDSDRTWWEDECDGVLDTATVMEKLDALAADNVYGRVFDYLRQQNLVVAADAKWIKSPDGERVWYIPLIPANAKRMGAYIGEWWWPEAPAADQTGDKGEK